MEIDPRGPRAGALITTVVLAVVLVTGSAWLLAAQAVVFMAGAVFGLRYAPYGVLYRGASTGGSKDVSVTSRRALPRPSTARRCTGATRRSTWSALCRAVVSCAASWPGVARRPPRRVPRRRGRVTGKLAPLAAGGTAVCGWPW